MKGCGCTEPCGFWNEDKIIFDCLIDAGLGIYEVVKIVTASSKAYKMCGGGEDNDTIYYPENCSGYIFKTVGQMGKAADKLWKGYEKCASYSTSACVRNIGVSV